MQTIDGVMKFCPHCHTIKSVTEFGYSKDRGDKLTVWCKACKNERGRKRYAENEAVREQIAINRKRRLSDPIKHAEQLKAQREWYSEHYQDEVFRENEHARQKRYDHSPAGRERHKRSNKNNRAHIREHLREYAYNRYHNDPEYHAKVRAYFAVRNNKKRTNGGTLYLNDWLFLVDLADGKCLKCGQEKKLTIDHINPVIAGGKSNIWNIQPLCDSCNKSKGKQANDYRTQDYRNAVQGYIYSEIT